jgi:hypothetical protein
MKRRHVISGFVGMAISSASIRMGKLDVTPDLAKLTQEEKNNLLDDQFESLDPPRDREQPRIIVKADDTQTVGKALSVNQEALSDNKEPLSDKTKALADNVVEDMDARDTNTMSVSKSQQTSSETEKHQQKVVVDKSIDFARDYDDDIFVSAAEQPILQSVLKRLKNLQKTIGFGHYNLVSFDQALVYSKRFSDIGEFTQDELNFIEKIFFTKASDYGFLGTKVNESLTTSYKKADVYKVPYSGHYLFKGESLDHYKKLRNDVGDSVILTSGIRSNVKQLYLFLAKTVRVNGNLSRASRSLAPPGYSFHGIGDFDVGRVGWGAKNFTDDFATTDEFKRMQDLGYLSIRYDQGNKLGVRFEPWHIKVV